MKYLFIALLLFSFNCEAVTKAVVEAPQCEIKRDKAGKIKRSSSARAAFQRYHPCPSTGKRYGACKGYVVDHIVALKRCGEDSPFNMQWQTIEDAKAKDKWE